MLGEIAGFIRRNGIRTVLAQLVEIYFGALFRGLPGPEGLVLRSFLYRSMMRKCGPNLLVYPGVYITFSSRLSAGKRLALNVGTYIDAGGEIAFGDHVMVGPNCVFSSRDHGMEANGTPMCFQSVQYAQITVGNDVWFGANCFIRKGVTIGDGAVIAAGCSVVSDVPPNVVFGGVPGRVLRQRSEVRS